MPLSFIKTLCRMLPFLGACAHADPVLPQSIYDFTVTTIDGQEKNLSDYRGKVLVIVNTASKCGFTGQYAGLETLYHRYHAQGLEILGFPANNFLRQEPGSDAEIKEFCTLKYAVTFPLFAKISVRGKDIAPLYEYLTKQSPFKGAIQWNFTKFIVNREGIVIGRIGPRTDPLDASVEALLKTALQT